MTKVSLQQFNWGWFYHCHVEIKPDDFICIIIEVFVGSCRNLREARDNAFEAKEHAVISEKEIASKYDLLQSE